MPSEKLIEVIDLKTNSVAAQWKMTIASSNFPMAIDETHHRLYVGCRHSPKLLVLDTQTGKTLTSLSIDSDVDDVFYNIKTQEIYLSCGAGNVDVFKQTNANFYAADGKISTHLGARTSLFIPETNQLIVACPSYFNSSASLQIFESK